jgi:hypothetical protein
MPGVVAKEVDALPLLRERHFEQIGAGSGCEFAEARFPWGIPRSSLDAEFVFRARGLRAERRHAGVLELADFSGKFFCDGLTRGWNGNCYGVGRILGKGAFACDLCIFARSPWLG